MKKWLKVSDFNKRIRRPMGYRSANTKIYYNYQKKKLLRLITMPRRPKFFSYGEVQINDTSFFKGSKKEAEDYASKLMR